jgi:DNA-binding response OmpR family regulator
MKRRILLVDDEVAVLLTLKAVLEISGFDVDTAASAREGKSRLRTREYDMVITDMRMESESSGKEVIAAARAAAYQPAIALLTAFPVNDENWQDGGADQLLVKPMQTRILLQQIEQLFLSHEAKRLSGAAAPVPPSATQALRNGAPAPQKAVAKKLPAKTSPRKPIAKAPAPVKAAKKTAKAAAKKSPAKR